MKITLDQDALTKAVISHLRDGGVTASIPKVVFRYTRVPYTVFAEVELAEQAPSAPRVATTGFIAPVKEREVVPAQPLLDPLTVLPAEEPAPEAPMPDGPAEPLFGGS